MRWSSIDENGRDIRAANAALLQSNKADKELSVACERAIAATTKVIREIDLIPIRWLYEMHANGK